jgi:hypothetical protein
MSCSHESTPKLEIGYDENSVSFPKLKFIAKQKGFVKKIESILGRKGGQKSHQFSINESIMLHGIISFGFFFTFDIS